jgi:hypothetical protein
MSGREKIIVGAMVVAVIAGGIHLLGRSNATCVTTVETPEQAKARVEALVVEQRVALADAQPNAAALAVEEMGRVAWEINPFSRSASEEAAPVVRRSAVSYTGYLVLGTSERAVLNGRAYSVGDTISRTGMRLVELRPHEVVLEAVDGDERETVKLVKPIRERGLR